MHTFNFTWERPFNSNLYGFPLKTVQGVEMGETLLRNSQLEVVLGAGVAAGCLDPSCSVEEEEVEIRRWVKL